MEWDGDGEAVTAEENSVLNSRPIEETAQPGIIRVDPTEGVEDEIS